MRLRSDFHPWREKRLAIFPSDMSQADQQHHPPSASCDSVSFAQLCLLSHRSRAMCPRFLSLLSLDVQGMRVRQEGTGRPPCPQLTGTTGLGQLEGPGILMERESAQALSGKSLTSRAESQPRDPERCRIHYKYLPITHDSTHHRRIHYKYLPVNHGSTHHRRQELEVQCPPGVTIGFVAEHWNLCRAVYSLQNEKKEDMMGVLGPCSTYGCGSDSVFEILSLDGVSIIGSITRKWNGVLSAMSDADHFEIHFPLDLDVTMKAMIFGACFLIDFMYFESSPPQHSNIHHD
ncbi:hypothetical protein R6Z07M_013741 [Ovis aries]